MKKLPTVTTACVLLIVLATAAAQDTPLNHRIWSYR